MTKIVFFVLLDISKLLSAVVYGVGGFKLMLARYVEKFGYESN
jgi:hypothetical protein